MMGYSDFYDIVMTQWVAPEGTARLVYSKEAILRQRFPGHLIDGLIKITEGILSSSDMEICLHLPEVHTYVPQCGGFYDSLWEIGEQYSTGFIISMERVPLLQMAVEVCDCLQEDIFELSMKGTAFIICTDGASVSSELKRKGIMASHIGSFNNTKDRILKCGERCTYLTPPKRRNKR